MFAEIGPLRLDSKITQEVDNLINQKNSNFKIKVEKIKSEQEFKLPLKASLITDKNVLKIVSL